MYVREVTFRSLKTIFSGTSFLLRCCQSILTDCFTFFILLISGTHPTPGSNEKRSLRHSGIQPAPGLDFRILTSQLGLSQNITEQSDSCILTKLAKDVEVFN